MRNLSIEQQKEFEKMVAEINRLNQENDDLIKSHNKEVRRLHNINKKLTEEINKLKKKNLQLIKENNKINKKLSSYEKYNDIPSEEEIEKQYKEYYEALEKEYCE